MKRKQHTSPCDGCPFARTTTPGALGGSTPETYIGQANGSFWIPCHSATDFNDPGWRTDGTTPQCVGAAMFRANLGLRPSRGNLIAAPDKGVFNSFEEFYAHHKGVSIEAANEFLKEWTPQALTAIEYMRAGATIVAVPKKGPTK